MGRPVSNGFLPDERAGDETADSLCINTSLANALKVMGGFIPAWAAFLLTQDNTLLMWLGRAAVVSHHRAAQHHAGRTRRAADSAVLPCCAGMTM